MLILSKLAALSLRYTIILFGATGDLSKRKIIPALYRFVAQKKLDNVIIVGAAFDDVNSDQMIDAARPFVADGDESNWDILRRSSYYKRINFTEKECMIAIYEDEIFNYNQDFTIKDLKNIEKLDAKKAKEYLLKNILTISITKNIIQKAIKI